MFDQILGCFAKYLLQIYGFHVLVKIFKIQIMYVSVAQSGTLNIFDKKNQLRAKRATLTIAKSGVFIFSRRI